MSLIGEVELTIPAYRALIAMRTSFISFYSKVVGIVTAVAGLAALSWDDGYLAPGILILAGLMIYFAVPPAFLGRIVRHRFPEVAGVWRYELDDDGVTWAMPSLRITAGWSRVTALDDRPEVLFLVLPGRVGVLPVLKSAFSEADREALLGFCRERMLPVRTGGGPG